MGERRMSSAIGGAILAISRALQRRLQEGVLVVAALVLAGCATLPRLDSPLSSVGAQIVGFGPNIRAPMNGTPPRADWGAALDRSRAASDGTFDILALSGGGAGGAFGAGALVGLSNAGARPRYEIVTGVSTGALMAPFAFLGPEWDDSLRQAYVGPGVERVLRRRGVSALFRPGVFDGDPLRDRADRLMTQQLIEAVARESSQGRLLLVATTNLDTQELVIWNMGEIAAKGGEAARIMFRDVLVASASMPGVFPPVMLNVEDDGQVRQEMHVDGGVAIPFFITPQMASSGISHTKTDTTVYVIINGCVDNRAKSTPLNTVPILWRGFETNQMFQARVLLAFLREVADDNGMTLLVASIPGDLPYRGSMRFDREDMRALFEAGERMAQSGALWIRRNGDARREASARPPWLASPKRRGGLAAP
jgi:predicted acylesterase/phospholipase RssA